MSACIFFRINTVKSIVLLFSLSITITLKAPPDKAETLTAHWFFAKKLKFAGFHSAGHIYLFVLYRLSNQPYTIYGKSQIKANPY